MSERSAQIPQEIRADLARATKLEWATLFWILSIIVVMFSVMGTSQAMKGAVVEDVVSLIPAIVFLIASRFERKPPTAMFPFGFHRVNSLAFLIAAVALTAVGGFVLYESIMTLVMQERPGIGPITLFGTQIWSGWLMIAALTYSAIPPIILGHLKLPVARKLHDNVLHTDALMQKADWQTAMAGIVGIVGVGLGYWFFDAAAAIIIALSIFHDGIRSLRSAAAELIDGAPRQLGEDRIDDDTAILAGAYRAAYPNATIRTRETGRFIKLEVHGASEANAIAPINADITQPWRIDDIAFVPVTDEGSSTSPSTGPPMPR